MAINLGIEKTAFFDNFFEKNFYLCKSAFSESLVKWSDVNRMLYDLAPGPNMQIHKNGFIAEENYAEVYSDVGRTLKRVNKTKLYEYLRNGSTVILNRIENKSPEVKKLCIELSRFVGAQTVANGYLAFGGEGSFGCHWDTHDVFAVQLIGRKRWQVFKPTHELPLFFQKSGSFKEDCPNVPVFDGVLEAGDILYIPRGWWHNALPIQGAETYHIAVGVHSPLVFDYMRWVLNNVLPNSIASRRSLGHQEDDLLAVSEAADIFHSLLSKPQYIETFLHEAAKLERPCTEFSVERYGKELNPNLSGETLLKPSGGLFQFGRDNVVFTRGERIQLESMSYDILKLIWEADEITFKDLQCAGIANSEGIQNIVNDLVLQDLIEAL